MELQEGDRIKLKGVSNHGKNRVREQGEWWIVKQIRASVAFADWGIGPFALLHAESKHPDGCRWIAINNDKNFEIIERAQNGNHG